MIDDYSSILQRPLRKTIANRFCFVLAGVFSLKKGFVYSDDCVTKDMKWLMRNLPCMTY